MNELQNFLKGFWKENPVFRLLLGLCPTLAVTTTALDGIGMGLSTTFVLVCSNVVVSLLKKSIPDRVRIPCYIVVIASFVTITDLVLKGFMYDLHKKLGLFIPLIVVNCLILGRAEAFASRNRVFSSFVDGLGLGAGFTISLGVLGMIRELLGSGSAFGINILGERYVPFLLMVLPPGAFITLGLLLALIKSIDRRRKRNA